MSSDEFNNAAGNGVDVEFSAAYSSLFNGLSPLLSSEHLPGPIPASIPGAKGKFQWVRGRLGREGLLIERDPKTKRPVAANAVEPQALRKFLRSLPGTGTRPVDISIVPASDSMVAASEHALFSYSSELAALKSILLTFDHLLLNCPLQFTRSTALAQVREFVRDGVAGKRPKFSLYDSIVMGLQYDKLAEAQRLRATVPIPSTPFEHLMIVSGNVSQRTIDAFWLVAGIDPYGFRLTRNWPGGPFTFVFVSGVLKGTDPKYLWSPIEFNCSYNPGGRAMPQPRAPKKQFELLATTLMVHHRNALEEATALVERSCPAFVRDCVVERARMGLADGSGGVIADALVSRLRGLYGQRLSNRASLRAFNRITARHLSRLKPGLRVEMVTSIEGTPQVSWSEWFSIYMKLLDELEALLGKPGVGQFESEVMIEST